MVENMDDGKGYNGLGEAQIWGMCMTKRSSEAGGEESEGRQTATGRDPMALSHSVNMSSLGPCHLISSLDICSLW